VHAHFGGVAARTAWWLRELFGFSYSFTGHANDIFCDHKFPIGNEALVRGARFVVTETDYARRWMEAKYPHAAGKVFRVFNGIDVDGFPPRAPAGPVPRIVSVGRFVEKKGFGDLIDACALLRERGLDFACEIIGAGPLEAVLRERIAARRLGGGVRLLGPRPQKEVREALARADLFALACAPEGDGGSDNLPTVIMEAMACGLPIVSTRLAGVPEMVSDGVEGFLTEPNDPPAFAAALERLLRDRDLAARCGAQSRASALEKYSLPRTTQHLKRLLIEHGKIHAPAAALAADPSLPAASTLTRFKLWLASARASRPKSL
jgi:colanic acid/amylovoran biosynthesis glycosyltransferase